MKRFALSFASLVLSTSMFGCGDESTPAAGTPSAGPGTEIRTAGEAKKDRDKMFTDVEAKAAKAREKAANKSN
jgi:hypothetical protein